MRKLPMAVFLESQTDWDSIVTIVLSWYEKKSIL
jgi:hypothetical protein